MAYSEESKEDIYPRSDCRCTSVNIAQTCVKFSFCVRISRYPNATIDKYRQISGVSAMIAERYARGTILCRIDVAPILDYTSGIFLGLETTLTT